jgi:hypothetical protein
VLAYGGLSGVLTGGSPAEIRVWGGFHLPSVGASILGVAAATSLLHGWTVWPVVGFVATATYLLMIGVQF